MSDMQAKIEKPFEDSHGFHLVGTIITVSSERFAQLKANGLVSALESVAAPEAKMAAEPLNKMAPAAAKADGPKIK